MLIFFIGSALLGAVLACFFRAYILLPTCAVLIVLVVSNPYHQTQGELGALASIALSITSLQLGYLAGLLLKIVPRFRVKDDLLHHGAASSHGSTSNGHRHARH